MGTVSRKDGAELGAGIPAPLLGLHRRELRIEQLLHVVPETLVLPAPRDALVADSVDERSRGLAFGLHRAGDTAGAVIGIGLALALIIMAGGAGTRLWPASRRDRPKQLLHLFSGKSLLRESYERAVAVVPPEAVCGS